MIFGTNFLASTLKNAQLTIITTMSLMIINIDQQNYPSKLSYCLLRRHLSASHYSSQVLLYIEKGCVLLSRLEEEAVLSGPLPLLGNTLPSKLRDHATYSSPDKVL